MPISGCSACRFWRHRAAIARPTKCRVQFRINKLLDEPTNPIPDGRLDRIEPTGAEEFRRLRRTVVAMLLHGVISLDVSPPSLARCTSRRLHHLEFPPRLRQHVRLPLGYVAGHDALRRRPECVTKGRI